MNQLPINLEDGSPEFHVGDYVLLSTEDIDIAKGLHGSVTRKYVGPFKILEERVGEQSRCYRVEAPKCLGFSECYFDKVVMFQRCQDKPKRFLEDKGAEPRREKVGRVGDSEDKEADTRREKSGRVGDPEQVDGEQRLMVIEEKERAEVEVDGGNTGQKIYTEHRDGNIVKEVKEGIGTPENTEVNRTNTDGSSPERTRELEPILTAVKIETPVDTSKATSPGPRRSPPRTRRRQNNKQDEQVNAAEEPQGPSASDVKADTLRILNSIRKTKQALEASPGEVTAAPAGEKPDVLIIDGEVEYEVEKILEDRKVDTGIGHQRMEYLVKWKGYPESEATWEPRSNLTHVSRLLKEYTKNRRRNGRRSP